MKKIISCCIAFILAFLLGTYMWKSVGIRVVAVGDIAQKGGRQAEVAKLILKMNPTKVLALGDTAYASGTPEEYATLYEPTFGAFKNKTAPAPGNHEYHVKDAYGYYDYFGDLAGPDRRGYYSFDLGEWHLISLNSERITKEQLAWLDNDLSSTTKPCILAYWHRPYLSSGLEHGSDKNMRPFWDILYKKGADLVLNGHEHNYERLAKVNPDQKLDDKGIREIVIGTGGAELYQFGNTLPVSETKRFGSFGALELNLQNGRYTGQFTSIDKSYSDKFSGNCNK